MKLFNKTILITVVLMSATLAFAHETGLGPGDSGPRSLQKMPMVEHLIRAVRRLDLSDDQKESIRNIMWDMKTEIGPVMADMKAGREQLKELIKAEEYDQGAVAELAGKEGDLAAERMIITSRALADALATLTDEQRAQLEEMEAQRRQCRSDGAGEGI